MLTEYKMSYKPFTIPQSPRKGPADNTIEALTECSQENEEEEDEAPDDLRKAGTAHRKLL